MTTKSLTKARRLTVEDLYRLPEAPEGPPRAGPRKPRGRFPNSLEDVSKHFATVKALKSIHGPLTLREALAGPRGETVSQAGVARLLAPYAQGQTYTRATLSLWERIERGQRLPLKYAMKPETREAFGRLVADLVALASEGRLRVKAKMGPRVWHFSPVGKCKSCGRDFTPKTARSVNCAYCAKKGK